MRNFNRRRRELLRRLLEQLRRRALCDVVMRALALRGHLIFCDVGDACFFVDPADRAVGASLMWQQNHQRTEFDRAVALLAAAGRLMANAVFVDVGANIGTHTIYAVPGGKFSRAVASEPELHNALLLSMNLKVNELTQPTVVVPQAAGHGAGQATLHLHPRNKGAYAIGFPPAAHGDERVDVPLVRLDKAPREVAIAADDIGLNSMDVEGYEPQALEGLGDMLTRSILLAFEFLPRRCDGTTKARLIARLAVGYRHPHSLSHPARQVAPIEALAAIEEVDDVLVY